MSEQKQKPIKAKTNYHIIVPAALWKKFTAKVKKEQGSERERNNVIIGFIKDYVGVAPKKTTPPTQ